MIVLDTNVLSELMRGRPDAQVLAWVDAQAPQSLCLTAITVAELAYGLCRLPEGKRKQGLMRAFDGLMAEDFEHQVLAFDEEAARPYAEIATLRERLGRPIGIADAQIAAICLCHGATLATRNTRDFDGLSVPLVNPWTADTA